MRTEALVLVGRVWRPVEVIKISQSHGTCSARWAHDRFGRSFVAPIADVRVRAVP